LAFADSINNAFIRLLRDIVSYEIAQNRTNLTKLLDDPDDPDRETYLRRFADQEGRKYMRRLWNDYHGRTAQEALDLLASRTRPDPHRLAVIYRSVRPMRAGPNWPAFSRSACREWQSPMTSCGTSIAA
jgi:hypothetical protein